MTDLAQLCTFHQGPIQTITADVLRAFFERRAHLRPATRARKTSAVARFLTWAEQQELLEANPMRKIDRVKLDPPQPRGKEHPALSAVYQKAVNTHHGIILGIRHVPGLYWPRTRTFCVLSTS